MLVNSGWYSQGQKVHEARDGQGWFIPEKTQHGDFVWLAFKDATSDEINELAKYLKWSDLMVEDVLKGGQQAKIEEYGTGTLLVTAKQYEWDQGELKEGEVALVMSNQYAVSFRQGHGGEFGKVRQRAHEEKDLLSKGTGFVLYAILDLIVDRYFPVIVEFERRVDALEEKMFQQDGQNLSDRKMMAQELHDIRRSLGKFKQGVEPLLEVTVKLFGGRVPKICESLGEYFRDVNDHLSRIVTACERLRDDASVATQTNLSLVTIEESAVTKQLAAYAAIFAVITLMAGVWGMNFEHMPELKWKYGYPCALISMITVSGFLRWKFKRIGWLQ